MNNPAEHGGCICTLESEWMCKSHVELALERQKMSSGERRGEVEVEKEGGERFSEGVVTPLLCTGVQEKRKWELVLHGAVEAARVWMHDMII